MFTGIVEETGRVESLKDTGQSIALTVSARLCGRGVKVGDSVAVNGCCLTVVKRSVRSRRTLLGFDLLRETWQRTNLQFAHAGATVNLERSLAASDRLGGHFVTGHIDGMGKITRWEPKGMDWLLDVATPPEVMRYVVFKGSIAVDGISLTVAAVRKRSFQIWIIPHTYDVTALRERRVGDAVNLEADLLAKYVAKLLGKDGAQNEN
ncbi:MAG: riboflavin synthase [Verrucomicrobia bacterium]|nr:riboflavin synthase [Verrucomicrobiota bacterium]